MMAETDSLYSWGNPKVCGFYRSAIYFVATNKALVEDSCPEIDSSITSNDSGYNSFSSPNISLDFDAEKEVIYMESYFTVATAVLQQIKSK